MAAGKWNYRRGEMLCQLPLKRLRVSAPLDFLHAVESSCDGKATWDEVRSNLILRWPADDVDACLSTLLEQGALVDAAHCLASQARVGWTPQPHPAPLKDASSLYALRESVDQRLIEPSPETRKLRPHGSPMMDLLLARGSARTFDDRALPLQAVVNILWSMYGVLRKGEERVHRTVPSGGALYGLRWFMALLRPMDGYACGWYEVRYHATEAEGGELSLTQYPGAVERAWSTLLMPSVLSFAHAVIYPVADIRFIGKKYGNRSLTLAMLEAGHALQNAALAAQLEGGATIMRGDTVEMEVLSLLDLDESLFPLPSLVLGAAPTPEQEALARVANEAAPVRSVPNHSQKLALPTRIAVAGPIHVGEPAESWSIWTAGRSENARLAAMKAEAEAWERIGWSSPRAELEHGRLNEIPLALDPRHLVMYSQAQYRHSGFPYSPFSGRRRYPWVKAQRASDGKDIHVMAQCVYALSSLAPEDAARPFTNASTSGVAAYTDRDTARFRALVELVERDAFARAWLGRKAPPIIEETDLSQAVRHRLSRLRSAGYTLSIHMLASDHLPVVAVFAQNAAAAFTSVTTAAGFDWLDSIDSALSEAESRIQERHGRAPHAPLRMEDLTLARHHGDYFQTNIGFKAADWFASQPQSVSLQNMHGFAVNGPQLLGNFLAANFDVVFCDLTPSGAAVDQGRRPLHVARAFVPGLIPIWFGYGVEPFGLKEAHIAKPATAEDVHPSLPPHPCT
ncbi:YcaO-like family protein [Acidovorax cavernicola]|nr:YcaO-like family protein [Acidovorax cavernicola]